MGTSSVGQTTTEKTNQLIIYYLLPVIYIDRPTFGLQTEILTKALMLARSVKNTMIITHTTMLPQVFIEAIIRAKDKQKKNII